MTSKIKNLKSISEKDNFWENSNAASKTLAEKSKLENILKNFNFLEKDLLDLTDLYQSFKNDEDQKSKKKFMTLVKVLKKMLKQLGCRHYYQGEADNNDCYLRDKCRCWRNRKSRLGRNAF